MVKTQKDVALSRTQRAILRRLTRAEARRLGYGTKFHDIPGYRNGPADWPDDLRKLAVVMRKLRDTLDPDNTLPIEHTRWRDRAALTVAAYEMYRRTR